VNLVGSLALGVVLGLVEERDAFSPQLRTAITVGFLGGLTTFSAFVYESWTYFRNDDPLIAVGYMAISLVVGLLAFTAGRAAAIGMA
jgi:CrcB protein